MCPIGHVARLHHPGTSPKQSGSARPFTWKARSENIRPMRTCHPEATSFTTPIEEPAGYRSFRPMGGCFMFNASGGFAARSGWGVLSDCSAGNLPDSSSSNRCDPARTGLAGSQYHSSASCRPARIPATTSMAPTVLLFPPLLRAMRRYIGVAGHGARAIGGRLLGCWSGPLLGVYFGVGIFRCWCRRDAVGCDGGRDRPDERCDRKGSHQQVMDMASP